MILKKFEEAIRGFQVRPAGEYEVSAVTDYTNEAMRALDEWHAAESYFNSIDDPDLVEYALYEVEAARRKYEYLMRKLRSGDAVWEAR